MSDELLPLQILQDVEEARLLVATLSAAGVASKISDAEEDSGLEGLGRVNDDSRLDEIKVMVRRDDFRKAKAILQESYSDYELPEGHYLLTSSDDELVEILSHRDSWSAFDVAQAERLAGERGLDLNKVREAEKERLILLKKGKRAPEWLIVFGWLGAIGGGFVGMAIAWSLRTMKEKTPDGDFFSYDEDSRKVGSQMRLVSTIVSVLTVFIWIGSRG